MEPKVIGIGHIGHPSSGISTVLKDIGVNDVDVVVLKPEDLDDKRVDLEDKMVVIDSVPIMRVLTAAKPQDTRYTPTPIKSKHRNSKGVDVKKKKRKKEQAKISKRQNRRK